MISQENRNNTKYASTRKNSKEDTQRGGGEEASTRLDQQRRSWKERFSTTTLALARTRRATKTYSMFCRRYTSSGHCLDTDKKERKKHNQMDRARAVAKPIHMDNRNCFSPGMKAIASYNEYHSLRERDSDDIQVLTIIQVGDRLFPDNRDPPEQNDGDEEAERSEKVELQETMRASSQLQCAGPGKGTVFLLGLDDEDDDSTDNEDDDSTDNEDDIIIYKENEEGECEKINLYDEAEIVTTDDEHDRMGGLELSENIDIKEWSDEGHADNVDTNEGKVDEREESEFVEEGGGGGGGGRGDEGELNHWMMESLSLHSEPRRDVSPSKYWRRILESSSSVSNHDPRAMTKEQKKEALLRSRQSSSSKSRQTDSRKEKQKYLRRRLLRHRDAAALAAASSMIPLLDHVDIQ